MTGIPLKPYYRPNEIADIADISLRTVYRMIEDGKIKTVKIGHNIRVARDEFLRFIESDLSRVS